ncbi:MAG TPA: 2-oxo acid dehydrogenase subunit E2 [Steroidobacteraceae bacterium]|nr:2-oxo acid dehydrogenase subunit E2 [Steroidobacteraceae bacterium]
MSRIEDVLAPANAEGTRATILRWCKAVGDTVVKDEPLVELETDKVTVEIPAPVSGTLIEVLKEVDAEVSPDEVLARLSLAGESALPKELGAPEATPKIDSPRISAAAGAGQEPLSPSVRRLLREHSIAAGDINGTGRNGRVTAQDVTRHAARTQVPRASLPKTAPEPVREPARDAASTLVPHTAIRRRVAEHMVRSLADAPHVTTLFEADLTRVLKHRSLHAQSFESRGTRLTLTVYFISACARALRAHPEVNATFTQDGMQLHPDVNIGVGTALGTKGLIVPVIHSAQDLSLFDIAQRLNTLVESARAGRLAPQDVRGGTFTISNHGVGGSLLAAPIVINQPQVAILGVGKVQRRVCVIEAGGSESIAVRPMCYLTLTIDHRALDAFQANAFLKLAVETLEQWPDTAEPLHD